MDNLVRWWRQIGQFEYPHVQEICISAVSGGSNGYRSHVWKFFLQNRFVNVFNLVISVTHYPSGCSKWNPIEHRLYCEVSKNCAEIHLVSMVRLVNLIRGTTTETGRTVAVEVVEQCDETGIKILP